MKSNIFAKTVKKTTLWSAILAIVIAAAIVVCALFGFNADRTLQSNKSITVSMNAYLYNTQKEVVLEECESICGKTDIHYVLESEMNGDVCELVFVFDEEVDVATLKTQIQEKFAEKTASGAAWEGHFINVTASAETVTSFVSENYVLRGVLAGLALAILTLAYVAIRYKKFSVGVVAGVSVTLGMLLTAALVILTRTPVTTAVAAVIAIGGLLTAAMVALTFGKIRSSAKEENGAPVEECIPVKESALFCGSLLVGVILVGVLGKTAAAWFAVSVILAIVASAFVALFFAPAMYVSVMDIVAKRPAKEGYIGAKKTSKKEKKLFAKVEEISVKEETKEVSTEETEVVVEEDEGTEEALVAETEAPVEEEKETQE